MKKVLFMIFAPLLMAGCQKEIAREQATMPSLESKAEAVSLLMKQGQSQLLKKDAGELQMLIQRWTAWAYGRNFSLWPNLDPDGHLQNLDQCSSCGVFMLGGGNLGQPVINRSVTIDISSYQFIFFPLASMTGWYNQCDMVFAPKNGQNPEAFYNSMFSQALNGKRDLVLMWDGRSILSNKQQDYRGNSGIFEAPSDPSNPFNSPGCTASMASWYSDGYWVKLPLTVGQHTLVFKGDINWKKKYDIAGSSQVTYNITVTNGTTL